MHFPFRKLDGESGGGGRIKETEEATVSRYHGMNEPGGRGSDDSPIDRHGTKGNLIAAREDSSDRSARGNVRNCSPEYASVGGTRPGAEACVFPSVKR